ncbi:hypothetical protein TRVA0_023S00276 [Trichomonascus vanleenenianus]|uniref:uncharacterized protein n=1 Tax=Trichomonascus vanleenenianus TaxID=2268995 RepID=UPI003ECAD46A
MASDLRDRIGASNTGGISSNKRRSNPFKSSTRERESKLPVPKSASLRDRIGKPDFDGSDNQRTKIGKSPFGSSENRRTSQRGSLSSRKGRRRSRSPKDDRAANIKSQTVDPYGRRVVPPARHPITNSVCVQGLSRPFNVSEFKILMNGLAGERAAFFWIDKLRTHCFAIYKSTDSTVKIRQELHGLGYPEHASAKLDIDFVPELCVNKWIKEEETADDTLTRWIVRYAPDGHAVVPIHEPDPSLQKRARKTSTTPELEWEEAPKSTIERRERFTKKEEADYLLKEFHLRIKRKP